MPDRRFGVRDVRIRGFRSARTVHFAPGPVCALVGGPSVGKSNVLAAIWTLLSHGAPEPAPRDVSARVGAGPGAGGNAGAIADADPGTDAAAGAERAIELAATLAQGEELTLRIDPPGAARRSGRAVPVLFLPAALRAATLVANPIADPHAEHIAHSYLRGGGEEWTSSAAPAAALVRGLERLCEANEHGLVLLIEEPELFLRPQAQRYLYRLLRRFAEHGNQVLYSTHEPLFLNVARLEELALVEHSAHAGTTVIQPRPLDADESFRALSEIDAERGELFLARAVLLVEGRTEKLTLPFVFAALGHDVDREAITIVDCGGKPNMRLFIRICRAARVPCVALHDRDAPPARRASQAQRALNTEIARLAGAQRTVELAPDFEAVAGLRGHHHKPAHAWRRFSGVRREEVPAALRDAAEKVLALARG